MSDQPKPGPELDALMAEKVMGWPRWDGETFPCFDVHSINGAVSHCLERCARGDGRGWSPSTDWRAAGEVMECAPAGGVYRRGKKWRAHWRVGDNTWREGKTGPHAICLAALEASKESTP